jgi:hypothetical protein
VSITHSDQLDQLAAALAKAQAAVKGAVKDSTNPFFKSKYPDLSSVWDACRGPLTDNGLSLVQVPGFDHATQTVRVETMLLHSSGQWIHGDAGAPFAPEKGRSDAQSVGSIVTYLRRYAVAAFASVCPEDDDGNGAGRRQAPARQAEPQPERHADTDGVMLITDKQVKLVWARAKAGKVPPAIVGEIVHRVAGAESMADIPATKLDDVLAAIAAWKAPTNTLPAAVEADDERAKVMARLEALFAGELPASVRTMYEPTWTKLKWYSDGPLEDLQDLYERIMKAGKREVAAV